MNLFRFDGMWSSSGWIEPAFVGVDALGTITSLATEGNATDAERVAGWAIPGVTNAHSHAFQYAMAGLAEHLPKSHTNDDFWSWREAMYELALSITPERLRAVAGHLYAQMIRRGFTSVAEFHYLHHAPDGAPYPTATTMAEALCLAAVDAGIRLTLVPVHYRTGDFGKPASPRQRRFLFSSAENYLKFVEDCQAVARASGHSVGGGIHSLRASPKDDTLLILSALPAEMPRHLHIAEQTREVDACLAAYGQRPVEWLCQHVELDERFHLVHATHSTASEVATLAKRKANVVLCPSTEGNLGDGLFPFVDFVKAGGRFSIGTDSHIGLDPWEELRWADYGQRLLHRRRNPLCSGGDESGELLLRSAVLTGKRATGSPAKSFLCVGDPLDAYVVDGADPLWAALPPHRRLSTLIFAPPSRAPLGTIIAGRWLAKAGRHLKEEALAAAVAPALSYRRKE